MNPVVIVNWLWRNSTIELRLNCAPDNITKANRLAGTRNARFLRGNSRQKQGGQGKILGLKLHIRFNWLIFDLFEVFLDQFRPKASKYSSLFWRCGNATRQGVISVAKGSNSLFIDHYCLVILSVPLLRRARPRSPGLLSLDRVQSGHKGLDFRGLAVYPYST